MGVYVITGGTTGIGAEVRRLLLEEGHEVFNVDYRGGDFEADLSTDEGVSATIRIAEEKYPDGIDGLISNAGMGQRNSWTRKKSPTPLCSWPLVRPAGSTARFCS